MPASADASIKQDIKDTEKLLKDFKGKNQKLKEVLNETNEELDKVSKEEQSLEKIEGKILKEEKESVENPTKKNIKKLFKDEKKEIMEEYQVETDLEEGLKELHQAEELTAEEIKEVEYIIEDIQEILEIIKNEIKTITAKDGFSGIKKIGRISEQLNMASLLFEKIVESIQLLEYELETELNENEKSVVEINHLTKELEGIEKEEKGDLEIAEETHSKLVKNLAEQINQKFEEEEQISKKESQQELENIEELADEVSVLEKELKEIITEAEEFEEEIKLLKKYSKNILSKSNHKNAETIERNLKNSSKIINTTLSEISDEKNAIGKIESELRDLENKL